MDGFELLQTIRQISRIPIIMLTAKGEVEDRIDGFEMGADDYLVKPFSPKELLLRVEALLKRAYPDQAECVDLGNCLVDLKQAAVIKNGSNFSLTQKELAVFSKLYENRGNIVTIGILCQCLCESSEWYGYENTLMTHIRHLREKIEIDPSNPKIIVTRKGLGYQLDIGK